MRRLECCARLVLTTGGLQAAPPSPFAPGLDRLTFTKERTHQNHRPACGNAYLVHPLSTATHCPAIPRKAVCESQTFPHSLVSACSQQRSRPNSSRWMGCVPFLETTPRNQETSPGPLATALRLGPGGRQGLQNCRCRPKRRVWSSLTMEDMAAPICTT